MRPPLKIFLGFQLILLGIELGTHYDTLGRQNALALTNVVALVGMVWLDRWLQKRGSRLSLATVVFVAGSVWLDALGNFQQFYGAYWWYDRVTHGVGGMAVTALFIDLFLARRKMGMTISWATAVWFGFLLGQFLGSTYEVSEWIGDELFQTARVRSAFDAPRDLLNNAIGGIAAVALFWLNRGKK